MKKKRNGKSQFSSTNFQFLSSFAKEVPLEENNFVNVRKVMDVNDISAKKCTTKHELLLR